MGNDAGGNSGGGNIKTIIYRRTLLRQDFLLPEQIRCLDVKGDPSKCLCFSVVRFVRWEHTELNICEKLEPSRLQLLLHSDPLFLGSKQR